MKHNGITVEKKLGFSYHYSKLDKSKGTTIRMSKKNLHENQIVILEHLPKISMFARITKIEQKRIRDIDLQLLKDDIAPFKIQSHKDFATLINKFYSFPVLEDTLVYIFYWVRVT